jgi:hypothetical protein
MVGGALEYLALITGYGALLIVVAILYALAYAFATRLRFLADSELTREDQAARLPPSPQPAPPEPA